MEPLQAFVLFLTFFCALAGLLLAFRVERKVTRMFGSGNLMEGFKQFFSEVPDGEGGNLPPQAAFYAFCSNIAQDCTDKVLEDLPGALASLGGKTAAKKAAKNSAFARGAQHLSEGGFGARPHDDGPHTTAAPTNLSPAPVEVVEGDTSLLTVYRKLIPDSGGAGRFRGGCGQEISILNTTEHSLHAGIMVTRGTIPARGYLGGLSGSTREVLINENILLDHIPSLHPV